MQHTRISSSVPRRRHANMLRQLSWRIPRTRFRGTTVILQSRSYRRVNPCTAIGTSTPTTAGRVITRRRSSCGAPA